MVWGGRRLARFLGKNLPADTPIGESWEVSDHPVHLSRLATATDYGITLRQLMEQCRSDLLGPAAKRCAAFPWLIKLLDANDWLSVQVHPDEEAVQRLLPGEGAKSEAWLVLEATPTSRIYAGLRPGVGPDELRQAIAAGSVADCLHSFAPKRGDFVYLPAGTVHAVGGGVLLAEIQQTSDATFRLFDWNRGGRHLHIKEGLASVHWDQGPIEPIARESGQLVKCPYFEIEAVRWMGTVSVGRPGRLQALMVTAGQGRFANGEFTMPGDAWIFPAAMPAQSLHLDMPLRGLQCTLP